MPGMRDFVTIRRNGQKERLQKRLVLCNLKELYTCFKDSNPDVKVGFSKFAMLRPTNCVLAGASGTHSVCVCKIHQNFKLMFEGADIPKLTKNGARPLASYKDCLDMTICAPPADVCSLKGCEHCPGPYQLIKLLEDVFEENSIEETSYKQWVHTDRAKLVTITKSTEEFLEQLQEDIKELLLHSFIAKSQTRYLDVTKSGLNVGEFVVLLDFSENYSMVIQDETHGYLEQYPSYNSPFCRILPRQPYRKGDS